MIIALCIGCNAEEQQRLRTCWDAQAIIVPVAAGSAAEIAARLPVALAAINFEPFTHAVLQDLQQLRQEPSLVIVGWGSAEVREQMRIEGLAPCEFWLTPQMEVMEKDLLLTQALQQALLRQQQIGTKPTLTAGPPPAPPATPSTMGRHALLRDLLATLAANPNLEQLLLAFVQAVAETVSCASYALLWDNPHQKAFTVLTARGLPPELCEFGKLGPTAALVQWYAHSNRPLTRQELLHWPNQLQAVALAQELTIFRAEVAIPLMPRGCLQGLLLLGEKILGQPYSAAELEELFVLTHYVTLRVENLQWHEQMQQAQAYMERSLAAMRCGLITLGPDQRIALCNPYAAQMFGKTPQELEGADLRALPSPLGDYLYAVLLSEENAVVGEPVLLPLQQQRLRVTTCPLWDDRGKSAGAVMLLEDMTSSLQEAAAAARQETVQVLTRIIGRLAHEIRTPLTAIKTYAELLARPSNWEEMARFWRDTVYPELERLDRLISEQVQLVEPPEPSCQLVPLDQLLQKAIATFAEQHPHAAPVLRLPATVPTVVADPSPTLDAFTYLLRYLYDHGASSVTIQVDIVSAAPQPRVEIRLRVRENNFPPDPAQLLDPLAVLQQEEEDLGPAISKQLIERQGGSVHALHEDEHFVFIVSFPLPETPLPNPLHPQQESEDAQADRPDY